MQHAASYHEVSKFVQQHVADFFVCYNSIGELLTCDFTIAIRIHLQKCHLADDTFIVFNSKKPKTIETVINYELKKVTKWLRLKGALALFWSVNDINAVRTNITVEKVRFQNLL